MPEGEMKRGYWFAALAVAIWAGFILVSRLGGVGGLSAYDITAVRYGTAAAILLPYWLVRRRVNLLDPRIAVLALVGGLAYSLLVFSAFKFAPATHAAVLLPGLLPFEIALFVWILLGERPSLPRWLGLVAVGAGVGCLCVEVFSAGVSAWRGDLLFFCASLCWALYTVLVRRWNVAPLDVTVGAAVLTALVYLPVYVLFLPGHIAAASLPEIALQAFYQGVLAVIVQMVLYMRAVALIGPTRVGTLMALVPALAGFAAVPVLGEALSPWLVGGLLLVSAGAWIGNRTGIINSGSARRSVSVADA